MGSLVDYDQHYRKGPKQCGDVFPELAPFLQATRKGATLLDLGCGQGRDSLLAARGGFDVLGVDLSEVGLTQLRAEVQREKLAVELACADVVSFRTRRRFDVVVLDRVLHLLLSNDERELALENACQHARKRATMLIADGAKHSPQIIRFFAARPEWRALKQTKRFYFAERG
jgi:2-polyprenyl-3-methyl-5-hydroxy-6-metoxy-1,4-benzoquinol methylase